jgi:hypothetical protein
MIKRWQWALACAVSSLLLLFCGLLVPAHLRAVDVSVIQRAGSNTPVLIEQGLALVNENKLGAAQLLLPVAQAEKLSGWEKLGLAINNSARQHPDWLVWGGDSDLRLERLFESDARLPKSGPEPFTEFVVRQENRRVILELLHGSPRPAVQELLQCRALNNTVLFPPSQSASGQAFDTAISVCGLLLEGGHLTTGLSDSVFQLASAANRGGSSLPLEQMLMDLMSLGQRFNWSQFVTFIGRIEDAGTLHLLADQVRNSGGQLPVLFSAVLLSGKPADVAKYFADFRQTGLTDLGSSLRFGAGGVNELLQRDQRLFRSSFQFATDFCFRMPGLAMAMKWLLFLLSGFLLAAALHFARPAVSSLERPLQVRGFHVAREILFALGFLLVVLLLSEPFLAQESQKEESPFRLHLPTMGNVVPAGFARAHPTIMNNMILLTLLLFFVLQGLIYIACLVKLAEIRRQKIPPRMKLKLLENEDHLFDAGLYLGFVGTIISLILVSMGMIKFSLMAAYSSTSFGIIFVCVFKIFNLRPARRRLLLEAEAAGSSAPAATPTLVTPS